jgi:hypothetical protein
MPRRAPPLRRFGTCPAIILPGEDGNANPRVSAGLPSVSQQPAREFRRDAFAWDGFRLRLRASHRVVAALVPDDDHRGLYCVHVGPDYIADIVNLTRAKEVAEIYVRAQRKAREG